MPTKMKYLWGEKDGDELHGVFDSIVDAIDDAKKWMDGQRARIQIWETRPARKSDADLFQGADEDEGGCDTTKPWWWRGRMVPTDVARTLTV